MSNAESDRKDDGGAEDDDEPDEWCAGIESRVETYLANGYQGHEDLQHWLCG